MLAFDDVWIEPQYSEIESRSHPKLNSKLSDAVTLKHPVIASNMVSVVGQNMALTLDKTGGIALMHRFMSENELIDSASKLVDKLDHFAFSVGVKSEDLDIAKKIFDIVGDKGVILVDIAHGHTVKVGKMVQNIKNLGYNTVIAGNVATADGYSYLQDHGANSVRVGIAGGKVCTTKYITGHHIPTLQSVIECSEVTKYASIIADGGISTSGDAAKALAAGADFVCLGTVLAATSDSPSEIIEENGVKYKIHFGMSSQTAIEKFFNGKKNHVAPEGKTDKILYTGKTLDIINEFLAGIRSALTYTGANSIEEFQKKAIIRYKKIV